MCGERVRDSIIERKIMSQMNTYQQLAAEAKDASTASGELFNGEQSSQSGRKTPRSGSPRQSPWHGGRNGNARHQKLIKHIAVCLQRMRSMTTIPPNTADIAEDYRLVVHEMGHFVVCSEFGIYAEPVVLKVAERYPESNQGDFLVGGFCKMEKASNALAFQTAVVSWAGVLAERYLLVGILQPRIVIPFPLTRSTLRDCFSVFMANFEKLSLGDQRGIAEYKRSHWVTFKAAYRILTRRKNKLKRLVAMQKQSIPNLASQSDEKANDMNKKASDTMSVQNRAVMRSKAFLAQMSLDNPDRSHFDEILRSHLNTRAKNRPRHFLSLRQSNHKPHEH